MPPQSLHPIVLVPSLCSTMIKKPLSVVIVLLLLVSTRIVLGVKGDCLPSVYLSDSDQSFTGFMQNSDWCG